LVWPEIDSEVLVIADVSMFRTTDTLVKFANCQIKLAVTIEVSRYNGFWIAGNWDINGGCKAPGAIAQEHAQIPAVMLAVIRSSLPSPLTSPTVTDNRILSHNKRSTHAYSTRPCAPEKRNLVGGRIGHCKIKFSVAIEVRYGHESKGW